MRIQRTLPPAVAPIFFRYILLGLLGILRGKAEIVRFEFELKDYFNVKYCFLVSSGKAALTVILKALHDIHPERDEVLIPAFNCYSVPSAITRAGLKIRLCDVNADTLDFNHKQLNQMLNTTNEKEATSRLLAIIPTHLFGIPVDIEKLRTTTGDSKIVIVEDAAQAMGTEWQGRKLGTLGDVGIFSLGRGKSYSTVEGGIILTDNTDIARKIAEQVNVLPNYTLTEMIKLIVYSFVLALFTRPSLFWLPKSLPFLKLGETVYDPNFVMKKMSSFQTGLARGWQRKLKKLITIRSENSKYWATLFESKSVETAHSSQSLIRFPVKIEDEKLRAVILTQSEKLGLGIMPTYPDSINGIQELKEQFNGQHFQIAKEFTQKLVTLPVHPFVSYTDKARIAELLKNKIS